MKILLLSDVNVNKVSHKKIRGTEQIVKVIFFELSKIGVDVEILGSDKFAYDLQFKNESEEVSNFFSRGKSRDSLKFKKLLQEIKPDIVQFHGFSGSSFGLEHLLACKELSIKTILWHNVPGITCMQSELLYMARTQCDGKFSLTKCTCCRLNQSIPEFFTYIFGRFGNFSRNSFKNKILDRLLSSRKYSYEFYKTNRLISDHFDHVRYGAHWVRKVLLQNDFVDKKLIFIRPSISPEFWEEYSSNKKNFSRKNENENINENNKKNVQFIFWGRLIRSKGIHVIANAIKLLNEYDFVLNIVGDINSGDRSFRKFYSKNKRNKKIIFHGALNQKSLFKLGKKCDAALIPSSWFETGPITVYEAFAMGLPVLGTKLGGIEELCKDEVDSFLFELNNYKELAKNMIRLIDNPKIINELRNNIPIPRAPQDLGLEIYKVYQKVLNNEN